VESEKLKRLLQESITENDTLRNRVTELEALLAAQIDENEQKDKAIRELCMVNNVIIG